MKSFHLIILLVYFAIICNAQNTTKVLTVGIEFRQEPIDIEDIPRGPLPTSYYGELTGTYFWQALSVFGKFGLESKRNWQYSLAIYTRHNHNHHTEDPFKPAGPTWSLYDKNTPEVKRIKYDVFLDVRKMFRIHRKKERYLTCFGGIGFTNINSQTDFYYQPLFLSSNPPVRYKGTFLDFGPRAGLGFQEKKFNVSIVGYFIEDASQLDLTALWLGISVSYDFRLKAKKR